MFRSFLWPGCKLFFKLFPPFLSFNCFQALRRVTQLRKTDYLVTFSASKNKAIYTPTVSAHSISRPFLSLALSSEQPDDYSLTDAVSPIRALTNESVSPPAVRVARSLVR